MPRALGLVGDGVLVAEPPHLWFCRDTNGDGTCDQKTEVASDYGSQAIPSIPPTACSALDNWIYSANYTYRFRHTTSQWEKEKTTGRGQWGITKDNWGRLFFNSNSDQLRIDLIPAQYLLRNPNYRARAGIERGSGRQSGDLSRPGESGRQSRLSAETTTREWRAGHVHRRLRS